MLVFMNMLLLKNGLLYSNTLAVTASNHRCRQIHDISNLEDAKAVCDAGASPALTSQRVCYAVFTCLIVQIHPVHLSVLTKQKIC